MDFSNKTRVSIESDNDVNYMINRLIYYDNALYQPDEFDMMLLEIKKIAQVISNMFVISHEDWVFIEKVKGMSEDSVDEDDCYRPLSNLFKIYKRASHLKPIIVDKFINLT